MSIMPRMLVLLMVLLGQAAMATGQSSSPRQASATRGLPMPRSAVDVPAVPPSTALTAHVSAALLEQIVRQPTQDTEEIVDRILDADVYGIARTKGNVDVELIPDAHHVSVDIVVRGTTLTDSIALQPPVKVYTYSHMPFIVRKRISINGKGVIGAPACAQVKATTFLKRITDLEDEPDFTFLEAATRLFYETKPEATYWVECKARRRLTNRVDREVNPQLKEAQQGYTTALDLLETQFGRRPDKLHFTSTFSSANLAIEMPEPRTGTKISPPPAIGVPWDLAFRVHENVAADIGQRALAGKTFTLEEVGNLGETLLEAYQGKSTGLPKLEKKAAKKKSEDGKDETVSITFARKDPLRVHFADGQIKLVVRTENYYVGGQDYQGFRLEAHYKIDAKPGDFSVVREGPPQIEALGEPTGKQKKLPKTENFFLKQAFENFTEVIPMPEINPPAPWNKIGVLMPRTLEAKNEWLILAWQRKSDKK